MRSEFKVEIEDKDLLKKLFDRSYVKGRLTKNNNFIEIDSKKHKEVFETISNLNNATIKVSNNDLIDGFCRFIVEVDKNVKIYPISIYCIIDDKKFLFY